MRVLRADRGVIETGAHRMGRRNLAVVVLQHVAVGSLQHARHSAVEARGVIAQRFAAASGLDANEAHILIRDKRGEHADCVGAAADAGHHRIRQAAFAREHLLRAPRRR